MACREMVTNGRAAPRGNLGRVRRVAKALLPSGRYGTEAREAVPCKTIIGKKCLISRRLKPKLQHRPSSSPQPDSSSGA